MTQAPVSLAASANAPAGRPPSRYEEMSVTLPVCGGPVGVVELLRVGAVDLQRRGLRQDRAELSDIPVDSVNAQLV